MHGSVFLEYPLKENLFPQGVGKRFGKKIVCILNDLYIIIIVVNKKKTLFRQ